jgi:hypothetical protein
MRDFLIYTLALFLTPFIAGFLSLIFIPIGAFITDLSGVLFKTKNRGKFFDVVLFTESLCATFLATIFLKILLLSIFTLSLNWIFIIVLAMFYAINGMGRIRASIGQARTFEIYETIADIAGILVAFCVFR